MKCVVPGGNVKIMAKAVHALAKIGEEMYVHPQENSLSFRTVNMANSAYADFTFFESFFSYYIFGDLEKEEAARCKISMRSAMTVFKAPNLLDKQVETCHIKLDPDASVLLFVLKYRNSITKTHLLPIIDCEKLQASYVKDGLPNQLSCQARVLVDAVHNFQQNLIEVTLEVSSQKLLLRNYVDETSNICNTTRTQLALGVGEFDRYVVGNETAITFCMKELRAALAFSETVNIPISVYFEAAGKPVVFLLKNPSFEGCLVLSTLNPDSDTQSESTVVGKQEKSVKRRTVKRKTKESAKSTSKIENRTINVNKKTRTSIFTDKHPCFIEEQEERHDTSANSARNNQNININIETPKLNKTNAGTKSTDVPRRKKSDQAIHNASSLTTASTATIMSSKQLVQSVFSTITKRKSDANERENDNLDDSVPGSPPQPSKKARIIFKKCFQTTFDPRMLPGHDVVLAEDSDECNSD